MRESGAVVGAAFRTRDLRGFQVGCAASAIGLWGFTVALAITAYRYGGPTAVGVAVMIRTLPAAAIVPISSRIGDRGSRRSAIVLGALASSAAYATLAAVVDAHGSLAIVLVIAAVAAITGTTGRLVQPAILPSLVDTPGELAASTGVWNALESAGFLAGAMLVGVAVSVASMQVAFLLLAGASALAALAFAALTPDGTPAHRAPLAGSTVVRELLLGAQEIRADAQLRDTVGLIWTLGIVDGMVDVLVVVVALRLIHAGAGTVGWLNTVWGAGGVIGGFLGLTLLGRRRFGRAISLGAAFVCIPLVCLATLSDRTVAYVALLVYGGGYALIEAAGQTLVQRLGSDEALARVFGVVESVTLTGMGVGSILAPVLVTLAGTRVALIVAAAILPVLVVVRIGRVRSLDSEAAVPQRELELLRGLDLFAPLPLATVETLAIHSRTAGARAGGTIIQEGEVGRSFFAILQGEVEVRRPDGALFPLAEGDYFGELALLNDVPRNADVTAVTDCTLVELEGSAFLVAVTGHVRSEDAVLDVARVRLQA